LLAPVLTFVITFALCVLIVATRKWLLKLSLRNSDLSAVQSAHHNPTPRLGGVAIFAGVCLAAVFLSSSSGHILTLLIISTLPVFLAGLSEDLGFHIRPLGRLLAAALSGSLAVFLMEIWIVRFEIPWHEAFVLWAPAAITFTVFCSTGVSNAFNLIDGVNGLSAGIGTLTSLGLIAIGLQVNDRDMVDIGMIMVASLIGFVALNYPDGRIFLGDAGAYSLGHILSWLAIWQLSRHPDISPWAMVLLFFWPIADTVFAIYRRRSAGRPTGNPDRMHCHQLVMRALELHFLSRKLRRVSNPLATAILLPFAAVPIVTGILLHDQPSAAFAAVLLFAVLFVLSYFLLLQSARRHRYLLEQTKLLLGSDGVHLRKQLDARRNKSQP
jgi:UDP-GlcNAc:undecaprenyl-phosphate GlcNAc-1-phosphate transferase